MPSLRRPALCLRRATLTLTAFALAVISLAAQTPAAATAVPMPTGVFSFPPSADPLTYSPTLTFDVVSVRETELGAGSFNMGLVAPPHTCEFAINIVTLSTLAGIAYSIGPAFQVAGGPDWIHDRYFRVEGKCDHSVERGAGQTDRGPGPAGAAAHAPGHARRPLPPESALGDAHRQRLEPGRRQGRAEDAAHQGCRRRWPTAPTAPPARPPAPPPAYRHTAAPRASRSTSNASTPSPSVPLLGSQLSTPVVDKTGQPPSSAYDFALKFNRDESDYD